MIMTIGPMNAHERIQNTNRLQRKIWILLTKRFWSSPACDSEELSHITQCNKLSHVDFKSQSCASKNMIKL